MKTNLKTISVIITVLAWLMITLIACNPVKQVLKDTAKIQEVFNEGVKKGWCVNDTTFLSDTTVLFDTLYSLDYKTDTLVIDDIKTVVKTEWKTITKTVTIKDSILVTDQTRINLLTKIITEKDYKIESLKEEVKKEQLQTKAEKKAKNKWKFYFWLLLAAAGIYIFRKPIFTLITKIRI